MESINGLLGLAADSPAGWIIVAVLALLALVLIVWGLRRMFGGTFVAGGKNRRHRLAVIDAAPVDARRQLVLVRRDDTEHLIMIGGPTDIVIEQGIAPSTADVQPAETAPVPPAPERAAPPARQPERPVRENREYQVATATPAPAPEPVVQRAEPVEPPPTPQPEPARVIPRPVAVRSKVIRPATVAAAGAGIAAASLAGDSDDTPDATETGENAGFDIARGAEPAMSASLDDDDLGLDEILSEAGEDAGSELDTPPSREDGLNEPARIEPKLSDKSDLDDEMEKLLDELNIKP